MQEKDVQKFITITVFLGIVIWGFSIYLSKSQVLSLDALKAIGPTTTFLVVFWAFYFKWGWKIPALKYLMYKPNLSGTWLGFFHSDWKDEEGKSLKPAKMVLVVRQNWLTISVVSMTDRFKSRSYTEFLSFDEDRGIKLLAYLYSDTSTSFGKEGAREGVAELELTDSTPKKLNGRFWTSSKTAGIMSLRFISSETIDSFNQAIEEWSENDNWEKLPNSYCSEYL
jgi:SMODS-associating 2TM, beta-strand rich effector domain